MKFLEKETQLIPGVLYLSDHVDRENTKRRVTAAQSPETIASDVWPEHSYQLVEVPTHSGHWLVVTVVRSVTVHLKEWPWISKIRASWNVRSDARTKFLRASEYSIIMS